MLRNTVKTVYNSHSQNEQNLVFKMVYRLMLVKVLQNAPMLLTCIKLQFVIKIFNLSIFKWPLKTGFTIVYIKTMHKQIEGQFI